MGRVVLYQLVDYDSPKPLAAGLTVSVNTGKKQLASIYAQFGVHHRESDLLRAHGLGCCQDRTHPPAQRSGSSRLSHTAESHENQTFRATRRRDLRKEDELAARVAVGEDGVGGAGLLERILARDVDDEIAGRGEAGEIEPGRGADAFRFRSGADRLGTRGPVVHDLRTMPG
jgi:hypothetical protein